MYTKSLLFCFLLSVLVGPNILYGQKNLVNKANESFSQLGYSDAINYYLAVLEKNEPTSELLLNLADAYFYNGEYAKAYPFYESAFSLPIDITADIAYRHVLTLRSIGNYKYADLLMQDMASTFAQDHRVKLYLQAGDYLEQIENDKGSFLITPLNQLNTDQAEFGATIYKGNLIYASSKVRNEYYQRIHSWTNAPFTKLYQVPVFIDGTIGSAKPFLQKTKSKYNESTPIFSKDGNTMYFSSNQRKKEQGLEEFNDINLYKSTLKKGVWKDIERLPFNIEGVNTAHPALSPDGQWLYFVSDRIQGYGQADLYRVEIFPNGRYGTVENLGDKINTESRETFPFISSENVLYFASDGHPGLGGLDIYGVQINDDNTMGSVKNLGASVNSPFDDFAFYLDDSSILGFMSSNRPSDKQKDNLYLVRQMENIDFHYYQDISGQVYDLQGKEPLANAILSLYDQNGNILEQKVSDASGNYIFKHNVCFTSYQIKVFKEGFNSVEIGITELSNKQPVLVNFGLQRTTSIQVPEKGIDLMHFLSLEPINFDFNKSVIRPDAERELYKVLQVLFENPTLGIDIRSFTDNVGNPAYNMKLSQQRAQATKK